MEIHNSSVLMWREDIQCEQLRKLFMKPLESFSLYSATAPHADMKMFSVCLSVCVLGVCPDMASLDSGRERSGVCR